MVCVLVLRIHEGDVES